MSTIYKNLGNTIRQYRKAKNYSTAQLAEKLNVSAGLVNNLENERNDVFRLELLSKFIKELDLPLEELLQVSPINIRNIWMEEKEGNVSVKAIDKQSEINIDFINLHLNFILRSFLDTISEYGCSKEIVESLSKDITSHLDLIRYLKNY